MFNRRPKAVPVYGESGCECNEQTEGLQRGFCCLRQPLSQSASRRIASSPAGEPFGLCNTAPKLSPRAGDSSRARPVDDKARGESGGIGSVASGSKARRPYSNQRSWHEVPKGEWLKEAKCREVFPLSLFTIVHRQLPRKRWSLLGAILYAKIYELTPRLEQGRLTHCRS